MLLRGEKRAVFKRWKTGSWNSSRHPCAILKPRKEDMLALRETVSRLERYKAVERERVNRSRRSQRVNTRNALREKLMPFHHTFIYFKL